MARCLTPRRILALFGAALYLRLLAYLLRDDAPDDDEVASRPSCLPPTPASALVVALPLLDAAASDALATLTARLGRWRDAPPCFSQRTRAPSSLLVAWLGEGAADRLRAAATACLLYTSPSPRDS